MTTHVVTKRLPVGDRVLEIGTEVDASAWRTAKSLEAQRYIKTIQPNERDQARVKEGENESRISRTVQSRKTQGQ